MGMYPSAHVIYGVQLSEYDLDEEVLRISEDGAAESAMEALRRLFTPEFYPEPDYDTDHEGWLDWNSRARDAMSEESLGIEVRRIGSSAWEERDMIVGLPLRSSWGCSAQLDPIELPVPQSELDAVITKAVEHLTGKPSEQPRMWLAATYS